MRYWPISVLRASPFISEAFKYELDYVSKRMPSQACVNACLQTMQTTPAVQAPNLIVIENRGGPCRRLFLRQPESDEWKRLERVCGFEDEHGCSFIVIDALH